jgi:hypothetical protein
MKNLLLALSTLLTLSLFSACAANKCCDDAACAEGAACCETAMVCPISGETCDADSPKAEFEGKQISLCCKSCLGKWNKLDDEGKKAALAKNTKS